MPATATQRRPRHSLSLRRGPRVLPRTRVPATLMFPVARNGRTRGTGLPVFRDPHRDCSLRQLGHTKPLPGQTHDPWCGRLPGHGLLLETQTLLWPPPGLNGPSLAEARKLSDHGSGEMTLSSSRQRGSVSACLIISGRPGQCPPRTSSRARYKYRCQPRKTASVGAPGQARHVCGGRLGLPNTVPARTSPCPGS